MKTIIDRAILLIGGCFLLDFQSDIRMSLIVLLVSLTISEFNLSLELKPLYNVLVLMFLVLCIFEPSFQVFLPLILYDALSRRHIMYLAGGSLLIVQYIAQAENNERLFMLFLVVLLISLQLRTQKLEELKQEYKRYKDNSSELALVMEARNREIQVNQDNQVHLATLQERNRIAREIHDNVGHMLTRSILIVGAYLTISKDEQAKAGLLELKSTLGEAMDSIRKSVHDLHQDSLDLQESVKRIISEFTYCEVILDYDMSKKVEGKVKLCFIAILKEALSNVIKHSNATKVSVVLREHPGIYQLLIHDNGNGILSFSTTYEGIGLVNMQDRVLGLKGTIHITNEQGFRIFIMVPKQEQSEVEGTEQLRKG